ncbi:MAG: tetratricopeptide repeat protein, partial [Flavobacteriales bacterium]|nr:tetratricopeptide repeat protein [Flavobacteriales bacterium]
YHKGLKIEKEIGNKSGIAGSLNNIGSIHDSQGNIPKALKYYHKSSKIYVEIGNKNGTAISINNIGFIYAEQGNIPKALEYYHKSLKIDEEIGNKNSTANTLNNIGGIYTDQGDTQKALEYYHKSLKIDEEIGNKEGIATSLNNIGILYKNRGDNIPKALEYYHKSLKIWEEIGKKSGTANTLSNIGIVYNNQGKIQKALEYHYKSLKIKKEIGNKSGIAGSLNKIGAIYIKQEHIPLALEYGLKSLKLSKEIGFPENIKSASELLSKIYEKQGKGMQALEMHKLYITMRDSINNETTQKATAQQQAKYEYEKQKTINDAEHNKQLAIEKQEKEKQVIITTTTAGGLGLVVVFLIFVFNRLQVTKKQKKQIESQKQKVESQKKIVEDAHTELEEKNKEILDSITYAKRIQSAILPPAKVVKEYLQESFILYKPKDIVSGDFYWIELVTQQKKENTVLFAAADCTGHGVPGAMVSVVCNNALNRSVREYQLTDPGEILNKTREIVIQEFEKSDEIVQDGMDIALCSLEGNTLKYAGAHNPLWIIRKGKILETKANKQPIGQFDNPEPYTTHTFELQKSDSIYIFSDGYVDQFGGEKGKKFKSRAFRELLLSIQGKSMEEQKIIINNSFETWKGGLEQIDDVCIIGVKV